AGETGRDAAADTRSSEPRVLHAHEGHLFQRRAGDHLPRAEGAHRWRQHRTVPALGRRQYRRYLHARSLSGDRPRQGRQRARSPRRSLTHVLRLTVPERLQEGGTRVIPGHGRLCNEADVVEYRDMVTIVRDRIQDSIGKGMTLDQVKATRPTLDYDGTYGNASSFIEAVYNSLRQ